MTELSRDLTAPVASPAASPDASTNGASGDCHTEWKKGPAADDSALDLDAARARLAERRGPAYWRSLEELSETKAFGELLDREFPRFASEWPEGVSRRNFLQLAAASLGLAGLTACTRQPVEKIVPWVRQPEQYLPGRPMHFATSMPLSGVAMGLLVESHAGRPTKIEGNPEHPSSLGGTDAISQASVLGLYDPDRSQSVVKLGKAASYVDFTRELGAALTAQDALGGTGIRLLTGTVTSPTESRLVDAVKARFPQARWHRWDPLAGDSARSGIKAALGTDASLRYDFAQADVVVAIEADFLGSGPAAVRSAHDFADRRRMKEGTAMNRLYVAESSPTVTGTMADHRLRARPSEQLRLVQALAAELGVAGVAAPELDEALARWIAAAAKDLAAHPGRAAVVAGDSLPAAAHALVCAMHEKLGAGGAVTYAAPIETDPVDHLASLRELIADMQAGKVQLLVLSGVNPVYDAPADLEVAKTFQASKAHRIHHGLYQDETAEYCHWHVPAAHYLESWGDARAYDGTVSLVQPLIEPLYGGKTLSEILSVLAGANEAAYDILLATWQPVDPATGEAPADDSGMKKLLHDGFVAGSALPALASLAVSPAAVAAAVAEIAASQAGGEIELALRADPSVLDGRYANNGWLQELPKPITKLTWDNAVLLSPKTAERLGVAGEDVVEITTADGRKASGPAWILPGQAENVATVHLGYGRSRAGKLADGIGFSAYALQSAAASGGRWGASAVTLRKTGDRIQLATTQGHHAIDWMREESEQAKMRDVVREATLAEFTADPHVFHGEAHLDTNLSFHDAFKYDGYAWGMTIDLNTCTGCNACVVACQSENNIPVVGKDQVSRGREMHWIRIDRYFKGDVDAPAGIVSQPIVCMQCEQAPCEVVCPVAATVHSTEGLNDMVYNRCVGTRYCSNNCPYKVRRFNFLLYQDWETEQFKLQRNPDVSVRSRGVMEKCTYCVQRINRVRIVADRDGTKVADGAIQTACQQACPTNAIEFGNLNDPAAAVVAAKKSPRNYGLLEELGTRPRTSYLALVRNPNPELSA